MLPIVLLLFVAAPIVELTILFKLGSWLGWWPTLAAVLGTGLAGAAAARAEGLRSGMRVRQQLAAGALPAAEMLDGVLILAAGALLLLPGVISDVVGLALLVPPVRRAAGRGLVRWLRSRMEIRVLGAGPGPASPTTRGDRIIEARVIETRVLDDGP